MAGVQLQPTQPLLLLLPPFLGSISMQQPIKGGKILRNLHAITLKIQGGTMAAAGSRYLFKVRSTRFFVHC
jgi:hypothetical protein